jgi:small subunit ribosomal protein S2
MMERKRVKLARSLGGVRNMKSIPSMLFITDCHREQLALKEAQKLGIPVVGVSDTNCDPTGIDFMIPGNDDSPRAVALYASVISTAVMEGLALRKQNRIDSAPVEKAPAKKAKPVAKDSAGKSGVAPEKKAGSAPIKTEKKSLVAKAKDSAKPKPAAAKPKPAAAKAKAAEEKAPAAEVKVAEKKAPAAEAKVAEKKAPAKKAKPAAKVKAVAKKVDGASEGKTVEKKPTAVKATKKSDAEK